MSRFAQIAQNTQGTILVSGPLKNARGGKPLSISSGASITVKDLVLNKNYGGGFSSGYTQELEQTIDTEPTYPMLFAEILDHTGKISPRMKPDTMGSAIESNVRPYISIRDAIMYPDKYYVLPGEWLNILGYKESAEYARQISGTGGGNEDAPQNAQYEKTGIGIARYRYVKKTISPINKSSYDKTIPLLDAKGRVLSGDNVPPGTQVFMYSVDGKTYQSMSQSVTYQDTDLVMPRDQYAKIINAIQVLYNPNASKQEKDIALQTIFDQKGMDYIRPLGKVYGLSTVARDVKKITDYVSGGRSSVPAETIDRLMGVLGVKSTSQNVVLKNPKVINVNIPSILPGKFYKIQVRQFVDDKGNTYYSGDPNSDTMVVQKKNAGMPIAQAISVSMAINSLSKAKTPEQRTSALIGIIDSFPKISKDLGIGDYSFSDLYARITQYFPGDKINIDGRLMTKMLDDPVIKGFLSKTNSEAADKNGISKLPPESQIKILLSVRDVFSNDFSLIQGAAKIQQIIKSTPGGSEVFPSIVNQPLINLASWLGNATSGRNVGAIEKSTLVYLSRYFNISEKEISELSQDKINKISSILFQLINYKNNPEAIKKIIISASALLPEYLPGVPMDQIIGGIYSITNHKDPLTITMAFLNNKAVVGAIEKLTGVKIFDENGKLVNTGLNKDDLNNLAITIDQVSKGNLLPLSAITILQEKNILRINDNGIISSANTLSKLLNKDYDFNNKDLANILRLSGVSASDLHIDKDKLPELAEIVKDFATGDEAAIRIAMFKFNQEVLPGLNLSDNLKDKVSTVFSGQADSQSALSELSKDPEIKTFLANIGLIRRDEIGKDIFKESRYQLRGGVDYVYNPGQYQANAYGQNLEIISLDDKGNTTVREYDSSGNALQDFQMHISEAQKYSIPVTKNETLRSKFVEVSDADKSASKNIFSSMSPAEMLRLVSLTKKLLNKQMDLFEYAHYIQSIPAIKEKYGTNFIQYVALINASLRAIQKGEFIDYPKFEKLLVDLSIDVGKEQAKSLRQAVALSAAFKAYEKGDYVSAVANLSQAFPAERDSDLLMGIARNLSRIKSGNSIEILQLIEQDKDLVRILQKLNILRPNQTLSLAVNNGNIQYSSALRGASIVLDVIHGKVEPLVACKELLEIPEFINLLGGVGKTLEISINLYEESKKFGNAPMDPAAIDASLKQITQLTGAKIGKLGTPGVNGLTLGQAVAITNSLTMAFNGKWREALMQVAYLIPLPGGMSVGVVVQVLFMFFPGLASIFGKGGGGGGRPDQSCPHCGCKVKDPGGSRNNRQYVPGGLLCRNCGCEVRSSKEPSSIPGSPPILSTECFGYPMDTTARYVCGPKTRSGLSTDCNYYSGQWSDTVKNHECSKQLSALGSDEINELNASRLSLFCQDEFSYYGTLVGNWQDSEQGKQRDKQYGTDKEIKSLKESEYYLRVNSAVESEFKKSPYYGPFIQQFKNNPMASGRTSIDVYKIVLQMYSDLIRTSSNKAVLEETCGFMSPRGDMDMNTAGINYGKNEQCDQWVKKINYYWTQLPEMFREQIFDLFRIRKDYRLLRKTFGYQPVAKK